MAVALIMYLCVSLDPGCVQYVYGTSISNIALSRGVIKQAARL